MLVERMKWLWQRSVRVEPHLRTVLAVARWCALEDGPGSRVICVFLRRGVARQGSSPWRSPLLSLVRCAQRHPLGPTLTSPLLRGDPVPWAVAVPLPPRATLSGVHHGSLPTWLLLAPSSRICEALSKAEGFPAMYVGLCKALKLLQLRLSF